ncbi:Zinc finger protein 169 [Eumeta japonica]|uniref:Zinc finger protein 169 n=1 Tax=Eumeta variegata TaxID=151549 RepID=A0A4C2ABE4_EUMVA|nr:Zinc finger protein 169 [Eumeta japonica]
MVNKPQRPHRACEICHIREVTITGEPLFFARFPVDENICREWLKVVGNEELVYLPIEKLNRIRFICGNHFSKQDFLNKKRRRLKKNAVPNLNLSRPPLADAQLTDFPLHLFSRNVTIQKEVPSVSWEKQPNSSEPLATVAIQEDMPNANQERRPITSEPYATVSIQEVIRSTSKEKHAIPSEPYASVFIEEEVSSASQDGPPISNEVYVTELNMSQYCRACLEHSENQYSVLEDPVKMMLMMVGNITVSHSDHLPQTVCEDCYSLCVKMFNFREKVSENNRFLLEALAGNHIYDREVILSEMKNGEHASEELENLIVEEPLNDGIELNTSKYNDKETSKIKTRKIIKKKMKTERHITGSRNFIEIDPSKIRTKKLDKEQQIRIHRQQAKSPKFLGMPHRCDWCNKGFNFKEKLSTHMEKYHKANSDFRCDICHRTLSNIASFSLHKQRHELLYECRKCSKCFKEKQRALMHYESEHEGLTKQQPCKDCGKVFRNRSSLIGHVRNHHSQLEKARCEECGKQFMSRDSLHDHMLIHTKERPHTCPICGATFRVRGSLTAHQMSHDNTRPHYCVSCDVAFKSRSSYNNHMKTARAHINEQDIGKHKCEICGRGFNTAWAARGHAKTHTAIKNAKPRLPQRKDHICDKCGARFGARRNLNRHERVHTRENIHLCPDCGVRFAQSAALRTHRALAHDAQTCASNIDKQRQLDGDVQLQSGRPEAALRRMSPLSVSSLANSAIQCSENGNMRNYGISPLHQLLLTLRFYALGTMLVAVGDYIGVSKSAASRIVREIPNIGEEFRNRKSVFFHERKVYVTQICILNVVARWPGSTHDATIFNNSELRAQCENGVYGNRWLIGDSVYTFATSTSYPLLTPVSQNEINYNRAHTKTRNTIERCFGVWKRRFPVLSLKLGFVLATTQAVVIATSVLHNICQNGFGGLGGNRNPKS